MHAVYGPGHAFLLQHRIHAGPQLLGRRTCARARVRIPDQLERRNACGRGHRVGVVRPLVRDAFAPARGRRFVIEPVENILAAGDGPAGHAAGHDLRQRGQIGHDAVERLCASGRDAETGDHFVEDQQHAVPGGNLAQLLQERRRRGYRAGTAPNRLDYHSGHVAALTENARHARGVVRLDQDDVGSDVGKHADGRRAVEVLFDAERRMVVPAVEVGLEAHDLALPGRRAGEAHREERRFGPRGREAHAFGGGDQFLYQTRPFDLQLVPCGKVHALAQLRLDCRHDVGMLMAQQQCAVSAVVVDVLVAIDVPLARTHGAIDVEPIGPGAPRVVDDAAWQQPTRLIVAPARARRAFEVTPENQRFARSFCTHRLDFRAPKGRHDMGRMAAIILSATRA